jgi:hypothetical protein
MPKDVRNCEEDNLALNFMSTNEFGSQSSFEINIIKYRDRSRMY